MVYGNFLMDDINAVVRFVRYKKSGHGIAHFFILVHPMSVP